MPRTASLVTGFDLGCAPATTLMTVSRAGARGLYLPRKRRVPCRRARPHARRFGLLGPRVRVVGAVDNDLGHATKRPFSRKASRGTRSVPSSRSLDGVPPRELASEPSLAHRGFGSLAAAIEHGPKRGEKVVEILRRIERRSNAHIEAPSDSLRRRRPVREWSTSPPLARRP